MHLSSCLTQTIILIKLFSRLSFFSIYLDVLPSFVRIWDCLSTLYWKFGLTAPKDIPYVRLSESDTIFFSSAVYLLLTYFDSQLTNIISGLNNIDHLCVDFNLIWSANSLLVFFLLIPNPICSLNVSWVGRTNSLLEKPQLHIVIVLPPTHSLPCLKPSIFYMVSSKADQDFS